MSVDVLTVLARSKCVQVVCVSVCVFVRERERLRLKREHFAANDSILY